MASTTSAGAGIPLKKLRLSYAPSKEGDLKGEELQKYNNVIKYYWDSLRQKENSVRNHMEQLCKDQRFANADISGMYNNFIDKLSTSFSEWRGFSGWEHCIKHVMYVLDLFENAADIYLELVDRILPEVTNTIPEMIQIKGPNHAKGRVLTIEYSKEHRIFGYIEQKIQKVKDEASAQKMKVEPPNSKAEEKGFLSFLK